MSGESQPGPRHRGRWVWGAGGVLLAFVAGRCLVPMDETDLFYNLRLGEIILARGRVPTTNLLSFTNPDFPDPNLAWLFQILLALVYRAGGIAGTVLLKTTFVVATFGILFRVCLRRGAHPAFAALALALAAWAAEPRFVERPHLVTFLGLATLLLALERAEARRPAWLYAMLPLGLFWANGNSCFFLAPAVLALYAVGARVEGQRAGALRAGLVALALVPLVFATPSGAGALRYLANHFRMPTLRPLQEYRVAEWPLDGPFFFLGGAVVLMGGLAVGLAPSAWAARLAPRQVLPILALAALGSRRIRFVAEFALLAGPYVAAQVTRLAARLTTSRPAPQRWGPILGAAAMAALALFTGLPRVTAPRGHRFDLDVEADLVPFADIAWVTSHGLRDHLYNDLEVGSYLAWEGWPRHRVFQDPRINGYPDSWHAWLRRRDLTRDDWQPFLQRFGVRAALISFPDVNPRAALFDPRQWALVRRGGESLVFVRRAPPSQGDVADVADVARGAVIADNELPLTFRYDEAQGVTAVPLDEPPTGSPVRGCEWQRRLGNTLVELGAAGADEAFQRALAAPDDCLLPAHRESARLRAAALALAADHPARAVTLLDGLSGAAAATNRGFALVKLDRADEALGAFDTALVQLPDSPEAQFGRGVALLRMGRAADAEAALRDFLARWPNHFAVPEARRLLGRGRP